MDFFSFLTRGFFFYVTAFGLRVSGLGFDVFVLLLVTCGSFYVTAFGLRPSRLGFHKFFLFYDLRFPF